MTGDDGNSATRTAVIDADPPQPERVASEPPAIAPRHSGVGDAVAITGRALRRLWRTPQLLFFALVQPVLFVVTLTPVFGRMVEDQAGVDYAQYLLPGVLVMCVALSAGTTGVAMADDLQSGAIDRFRSLPMARHALLVGRTAADLCRNAAAAVLVVAASMLLGFRFERGLLRAAAAFGLVLLFGFALSWLFATVGLVVRDVQTAQFLGFAPVMPLVFLSGAWIPVDVMAGGLQAFARHQPVNVTIEAARSLVEDGGDTGTWVLQSLLWSGAILAVYARLAVRSYRRSSG